MAFATVNGGTVHFADEGDGHALVFINSLGTDFRIWDELVAPMKAHHRVLRYDKRGHGLSEMPAGAAAMGDYATDLAALMDRQRIRGATIVGLSIGGLIAQELIRLRPDLVASLVLCDTAAKIGTDESWALRIGAVERDGIDSIAENILKLWFSADFRAHRRDEFNGWRAMLTRTPKPGYVAACRALAGADLRAAARGIRVPTLCVVGDEDGSTPVALVRELAGLIPGARFEIIAGAGHIPNLEKPEALRALILSHLHSIVKASDVERT